MGWISDSKAGKMRNAARAAFVEQRNYFTPKLDLPSFSHALGTSDVSDWASMIEAIESEGWELQHWAVGGTQNVHAFPVFIRRAR